MDVRKNAAWLIQNEAESLRKYIRGVRALKQKTRPGSSISIYDEFVAVHRGVVALAFSADWLTNMGGDPALVGRLSTGRAAGNDGAHGNSAFLPWHRVYLRRLEIEIQTALQDDTVTIPYWDWTDQVGTAAIFTEEFLGPNGGGGAVPTGHFSAANWPVRADLQFRIQNDQVETLGTALVRDLQPFTELPEPNEVNLIALQLENFDEFRTFLEGEGVRLHDFIHGWIGGSMAMMTSPNDPIFFMHHAFIDFIWARWQKIRRETWQQDAANQGQQYELSIHYEVPPNLPYGHNLEDLMWPWDVGNSTPAIFLPAQNPYPVLQAMFLTADIPVHSYSLGDRMRPLDALDHEAMGFTYDAL